MKKVKDEIMVQELIETAVSAACEACVKDIDEKIQAAINLGITIGAETGAQIGAASAVKAIEKERKQYRIAKYDRRYHNTKLLLKHYRSLNEYYRNAVFDILSAEEADEEFADIMQIMNNTINDDNLYIESIKRSCIRTKVIMAHVNKMLDIYKIMCNNSGRSDDARHWRVLEAMYISDNRKSVEVIAEKEHIDKRTVYKDVDACIMDLTTLFFGIVGIENL